MTVHLSVAAATRHFAPFGCATLFVDSGWRFGHDVSSRLLWINRLQRLPALGTAPYRILPCAFERTPAFCFASYVTLPSFQFRQTLRADGKAFIASVLLLAVRRAPLRLEPTGPAYTYRCLGSFWDSFLPASCVLPPRPPRRAPLRTVAGQHNRRTHTLAQRTYARSARAATFTRTAAHTTSTRWTRPYHALHAFFYCRAYLAHCCTAHLPLPRCC